MADKILNTRIKLKIDTLAHWEAIKDTFKPMAGEVCIVEVPSVEGSTLQPMMLKIGQYTDESKTELKTWGQLDWVSAKAADVYNWAKKPNLDVNDLPILPITVIDDKTKGKFITDISYENDTFTITRSDVDWTDIKNAPDFALAAHLGVVANLTTTAKVAVDAINEHDTEIGDLTSLNTTNKDNLVSAINEALQAVEVGGTGSVVTVAKQETPTEGSEATYVVNQGGKAVDVKIEIPKYDTSADYGILSIANAADDKTLTIDNTNAQNPTIKVTPNTFDAYGAASQALKEAKEYADAKPHVDTQTQVVAGGDYITVNPATLVAGEVNTYTVAVNEAALKTLIGEQTTAAMEFKGATSSLPEAPAKGDMYKVTASFEVAGETAKVGDSIVYNGEEWFLIPSGDDIEDTWRPIIAGGNTLETSETLELVAGTNVAITEDGGKVTISATDTTYTADNGLELLENNVFAIKTSGVTADKIANGAVTTDKLGADVKTTLDSKQEQFATLTKIEGVGIAGVNIAAVSEIKLEAQGQVTVNTSAGGFKFNNKDVAVKDDLAPYALKTEIPTDFGVTKITSNDTTSSDDSNISGLKVTPVEGTGEVNIEIDDTITFIFDCGGAIN